VERVDVVIVGQGVVALAAATRAAHDGVRALFVDRGPRLANAESLSRVPASVLERLGLEAAATEQAIGPSPSEDHAVLTSTIGQALERRARSAGVAIQNAPRRPIELKLEAGGWLVTVEGGEPVRAPLLILAEDARALLAEELGIGRTQRTTEDAAEIATWVAATWLLPPSELGKHSTAWVRTGAAPLTRSELLAGRDRVTLRVGPIWAAENGSAQHPAVVSAVSRAARKLGLPPVATTVEVEEVRLDAMPCPTAFDGGLVIGAGAGHASRVPGIGIELDLDLGEEVGRAAARAVLAEDFTTRALELALGDAYRALFERAALPALVTTPRPVFSGFAPRA